MRAEPERMAEEPDHQERGPHTIGHVDGLIKLPGRVIEARPLDWFCFLELDLDFGAHQNVPTLLGNDLHEYKEKASCILASCRLNLVKRWDRGGQINGPFATLRQDKAVYNKNASRRCICRSRVDSKSSPYHAKNRAFLKLGHSFSFCSGYMLSCGELFRRCTVPKARTCNPEPFEQRYNPLTELQALLSRVSSSLQALHLRNFKGSIEGKILRDQIGKCR